MAIFLLIVHIIGNFVKVSVLTVIMLKILNLIRLVVELLSCSCGIGISCDWVLVVFLNDVWTLKNRRLMLTSSTKQRNYRNLPDVSYTKSGT